MKNTVKLTFSAIMAALSAAVMLTSLFPYLTIAIPAVAGLFVMLVTIELGAKWATLSFLVSAVMVALLPGDIEAKMLYIVFFGYYPVLKAFFEKPKSRVVEYVFKFLTFNAIIVLAYSVIGPIIGLDQSDFGDFGKYTAVILLLVANVVFPIYDLAVSRMAMLYMIRLHKSVSRIISK